MVWDGERFCVGWGLVVWVLVWVLVWVVGEGGEGKV